MIPAAEELGLKERRMRMIVMVGAMLAAGGCMPGMHGGSHHADAAAASSAEINIQGDQSAWINNDHTRAFYTLSVERLGKTAPKLDFADYRDRSYAIFRQLGTSMGWSAEEMVDHLKLIPQQMVDIARENRRVLDSYDTFIVALMGPQ